MNKLTKLLSVFIIAGAIGTGVAGAVGCSNTPEPEPTPEGGHTHQTWSTTGTDNEDGTHKLTCTTEGCTETKNEAHKDADEDDVCDVCLADMEAVDPNAITSIVISFDNASPKAGQTVQCTATCTPATAADKSVTWSITSGDSLATIDATTGVLTIKSDATNGGEVTVKATSVATPSKTASKPITLKKASEYDRLSKLTTCTVDSADWTDAQSLTEITADTVGNGGIYMHGTNAAVSVAKGVATTNGGGLYVDFGTTQEIIEGALTVKIVKKSGTGWGFTRIMNRTLENTDDYALSGRDNGQYRFKGTSDMGTAGTSVGAVVPSADIEVYFKINKASGMAVLKYGDTTVYDGFISQTNVVGIGIFGKAVSDANQLEIKDVAICTYNLTLDEYKADYKAMIDSVAAETLKLEGSGWTYEGDTTNDILATGAALDKLLEDFDAALTAAQDRNAVMAAVMDANEAYIAAITNEYTAKVNAVYPATDYTGDENGAAYEAALGDLIADISEAAMTPAEFTKILENYVKKDGVFDLILTNAEANKMTVVIEIYNDTTKIGTVTTVNGATLKDGAKVSLDDIDKACEASLPAGKGIGKIFTDEEMTAAKRLTGDYTASADNGTTTTVGEGADAEEVSVIKLYVSYGDRVSTTISSALSEGADFTKAGSLNIAPGIKGVFEASKAGIVSQSSGDYTTAYDIGGKSKSSAQYVEIDVTAACKISVVFASGKDGVQSLAIFKDSASDPTKADGLARKDSASKTALTTLTYRVAANATGKYYLCSTSNLYVFKITLDYEVNATSSGTTPPPEVGGEEGATAHTYTFNYSQIDQTTVADVDDGNGGTKKDTGAITAGTLSGEANSFLTVGSGVTYRTSPECIENKGDGLTVTFQGTGTIAITYASTSAKNKSRCGLKDSEGNYLEATYDANVGTVVRETEGDAAGSYVCGDGASSNGTGSVKITLTYTITEAGTYTITCPYDSTINRGARIFNIVMVDNFADAE